MKIVDSSFYSHSVVEHRSFCGFKKRSLWDRQIAFVIARCSIFKYIKR